MNNQVTVIPEEIAASLAIPDPPEPQPVVQPRDLPKPEMPPIDKETQRQILIKVMDRFRCEDVTRLEKDAMKMLWTKYQKDVDMALDHNILDVLMPCEEGRYINPETFRSLDIQGYDWRLFVSTKYSDGNHEDARNQVKGYGLSRYVLFLDNDLELQPNSLKAMMHFLQQPENRKVACITLRRIEYQEEWTNQQYDGLADYPSHVGMSCNLWRREVLNAMTFTKRGSCECNAMCEDLRAAGYEIGVLRGMYCLHLKSKF